ncbi:hypothetical protein OCH239_19995 [Roseivivax halodurans JCM 10272]|uniref:Uncharacterized protein n=1 Tax=Roseivivax halodurans JCM 10272 TaxID=1449350 RepID=X7EGS7_9RHOB|nr:hypothetical protein [Roseivivax halodurans]ETX15085.1 hypothetical protein OCH239_19995 [Roseivivax halodurans JCM 10272]
MSSVAFQWERSGRAAPHRDTRFTPLRIERLDVGGAIETSGIVPDFVMDRI